jgi:endoglucanase
MAGAAFPQTPEKNTRPARGVSIAGPEFGTAAASFSNEEPGVFGRDYTYNSERTVAYFCEKQFRILRLPVRWERLQPRLTAPLDKDELQRVKEFIGWAGKHGGRVIIDIHNFGRYVVRRDGQGLSCIIDQKLGDTVVVSRDHFADLWRRLSKEFAGDSSIYAYGLMNEPHDMGTSDWKLISQTAVDAIRVNGDKTHILVAGDDWSSSYRFVRANGAKPWIKDPANHIAYEAHCYFDGDHSGRYADTHDTEAAKDEKMASRAAERLAPFIGWCQANKVRGFVGEFGIPRDDPRWHDHLTQLLRLMDAADTPGCYWAAGEWWGNYPLSIQPEDHFRRDAPQLRVLVRRE